MKPGFYKQDRTVAMKRAGLVQMLCHAPSLDTLTVDYLVRTHGLSAKETEYELTLARQRRAA